MLGLARGAAGRGQHVHVLTLLLALSLTCMFDSCTGEFGEWHRWSYLESGDSLPEPSTFRVEPGC
eukprot:1188911-Prorocentrum_minimum.AAC.2